MGAAALEDYAYIARGLVDYGQFLGDESDLELAARVAYWGWERFHRQNAWYHQDRTLLAPVAGEEVLSDSAYPAASAVLIEASLHIAALTDDRQLRERSLSALNRGQQHLATAPFWYAGQLGAVRQALTSGN